MLLEVLLRVVHGACVERELLLVLQYMDTWATSVTPCLREPSLADACLHAHEASSTSKQSVLSSTVGGGHPRTATRRIV